MNYIEQNKSVKTCSRTFLQSLSRCIIGRKNSTLIIYLQRDVSNQKRGEKSFGCPFIHQFRITFYHIHRLLFLLLRKNMLTEIISFESPSKALKTDIETFRLGIVFCLHINQFYHVSKLMKHSVLADNFFGSSAVKNQDLAFLRLTRILELNKYILSTIHK
jgi:hypothetical protein